MYHTPELAYADVTHEPADTEELTVQIQLACQGPWHRKAVGGMFTACGVPVDYGLSQGRHEKYADELCTEGCFSAFELALAETTNRARREAEEADHERRTRPRKDR